MIQHLSFSSFKVLLSQIFWKFRRVSSLKLNIEKSEIYCMGVKIGVQIAFCDYQYV